MIFIDGLFSLLDFFTSIFAGSATTGVITADERDALTDLATGTGEAILATALRVIVTAAAFLSLDAGLAASTGASCILLEDLETLSTTAGAGVAFLALEEGLVAAAATGTGAGWTFSLLGLALTLAGADGTFDGDLEALMGTGVAILFCDLEDLGSNLTGSAAGFFDLEDFGSAALTTTGFGAGEAFLTGDAFGEVAFLATTGAATGLAAPLVYLGSATLTAAAALLGLASIFFGAAFLVASFLAFYICFFGGGTTFFTDFFGDALLIGLAAFLAGVGFFMDCGFIGEDLVCLS